MNPLKYILLLILTAWAFTSCDTNSLQGAEDIFGENMSFSFSMVTSEASASRADAQGHAETTSEYLALEDGIDINDLGVFIFAQINSTNSPSRLVYKLTNLANATDERVTIMGTPGYYTINVTIKRSFFKELFNGYEISADESSNITFRMIVLANCSSAGTDAAYKWNQINGQDYETVINQLSQWNYAMSYLYNESPDAGDSVTDLYGSTRKKHLPMFGTAEFTATESAIFYSRPENRVYLGSLYLLRSVAKVRVVDNIQYKMGGYPYIESVNFISSQTQARQLPANALTYENGQQVHAPNLYADNTLNQAAVYRMGIMPAAWCMTPASQRTGNVFVGYVPEQKIGYRNDVVEQDYGMPMFQITVKFLRQATSTTTEEVERVYNVPMTAYSTMPNPFYFGDAILRNHIYTLSVNNAGATLLDTTVDLVPYRSCVLDPVFGIDREENNEEEENPSVQV